MTDELTPEQEADIRRLLAEARHDEPIPADVVARLDAALGDLTRDDVITYGRATVTDLDAARRRRRNAGRLLLAAAAVVVGGVAVGQSIGTGGSDDMDAGSATAESGDSPRSTAADGDDAAGGETGTEDFGEANEPPAPAEAPDDLSAYLTDQLGSPLSFTSDNFAAEVQASLASPARVRREAAYAELDAVKQYAIEKLWTCPDGDYGDGAKLPAYYDEQEAVLVLRRPTAGIQRVDLLECGTAAVLQSVDLPAR